MSKSLGIPHLGHKSSDVRGLAQATVDDGNHDASVKLHDALMDVGETTMSELFEVGKNYFIETLTKYWVGKCVVATGSFVVLDSACWVASMGYPDEFFKTGKSNNLEVELYGDGWRVPIGMITGSKVWPHKIWTAPVRGSDN